MSNVIFKIYFPSWCIPWCSSWCFQIPVRLLSLLFSELSSPHQISSNFGIQIICGLFLFPLLMIALSNPSFYPSLLLLFIFTSKLFTDGFVANAILSTFLRSFLSRFTSLWDVFLSRKCYVGEFASSCNSSFLRDIALWMITLCRVLFLLRNIPHKFLWDLFFPRRLGRNSLSFVNNLSFLTNVTGCLGIVLLTSYKHYSLITLV